MDSVTIKRYSVAFKQSVVREYEDGASLYQLNRKYGIRGSTTIKSWVEKFGRYGTRHKLMVIQKPEEQNRVEELSQKIAALEHALAEAQLDRLMLTSCLKVAEKQYGFDLKKTREQLSSSKPKRTVRK